MSDRFTRDGDAALERHLAQICAQVATGARALVTANQLAGVLLGGGYGRGEGGVFRTPAGDQPYNDMEFYVFTQADGATGDDWHTLATTLTAVAGIDVEFKLLPLAQLRRAAPSMFYYDLVVGHRWVIGNDTLLAGCDHHRDAARIPLHEATRLLMNRCCGLLFAAERLQRPDFSAADADFVTRNLAKAQLAFGDVVLVTQGQYHWSCQERQRRLLALPAAAAPAWLAAIQHEHTPGVAFKLHPGPATESRDALLARHTALLELARQLWLWLENRRLGTVYTTGREYAASRRNKCPETPAWRNWLINARDFHRVNSTRYPREQLLELLAAWLEEPQSGNLPGHVAAIEPLWRRYG